MRLRVGPCLLPLYRPSLRRCQPAPTESSPQRPRRLLWSVDSSLPTSKLAAANPAIITVEPHPERHMGLRPIRPVDAIYLCGIFAFLNLYATQPLLPMLTHLFHASKAAVGLTVSA